MSESNQGPKGGGPPPAAGEAELVAGQRIPMLEPDAAQARRIYEQIIADRAKTYASMQAALQVTREAMFPETTPAAPAPQPQKPSPPSVSPASGQAASEAEIAALESQAFAQFTSEAQQSHEEQRKLMEAKPAVQPPLFAPPVFGYPMGMFPPLPPPPSVTPPAQFMAVAQAMQRWLARCDAFSPVAERLRAAGRSAFAERLQFERLDTAQATKIVLDMARSAGATERAIWAIATDAQRAVTETQLAINARQRASFDQTTQAFIEYQQGVRRVICPDCQHNYFTSRYCRTCGGTGMVLIKA